MRDALSTRTYTKLSNLSTETLYASYGCCSVKMVLGLHTDINAKPSLRNHTVLLSIQCDSASVACKQNDRSVRTIMFQTLLKVTKAVDFTVAKRSATVGASNAIECIAGDMDSRLQFVRSFFRHCLLFTSKIQWNLPERLTLVNDHLTQNCY